MRQMNASDFKAKCLAILDEIARTGESVLILKRGKPVAEVFPAAAQKGLAGLKGTVRFLGDIDGPTGSPSDWTADEENL